LITGVEKEGRAFPGLQERKINCRSIGVNIKGGKGKTTIITANREYSGGTISKGHGGFFSWRGEPGQKERREKDRIKDRGGAELSSSQGNHFLGGEKSRCAAEEGPTKTIDAIKKRRPTLTFAVRGA